MSDPKTPKVIEEDDMRLLRETGEAILVARFGSSRIVFEVYGEWYEEGDCHNCKTPYLKCSDKRREEILSNGFLIRTIQGEAQ
jgi:hypothetical protein